MSCRNVRDIFISYLVAMYRHQDFLKMYKLHLDLGLQPVIWPGSGMETSTSCGGWGV